MRKSFGVVNKNIVKQKANPLNKSEFKNAADLFENKLCEAVQGIAKVTTTSNEIEMRLDKNTAFRIIKQDADRTIALHSPISGIRFYEYNRDSKRWEDTMDTHDMEGLLTRDLMRLTSGVPKF